MASAQITQEKGPTGNLVFQNTTGDTVLNISDQGGLPGFFAQGECQSDEAIKTINSDGSYVCNSISTTTSAENLSETLSAGNRAGNNNINLTGNNITNVDTVKGSSPVRFGDDINLLSNTLTAGSIEVNGLNVENGVTGNISTLSAPKVTEDFESKSSGDLNLLNPDANISVVNNKSDVLQIREPVFAGLNRYLEGLRVPKPDYMGKVTKVSTEFNIVNSASGYGATGGTGIEIGSTRIKLTPDEVVIETPQEYIFEDYDTVDGNIAEGKWYNVTLYRNKREAEITVKDGETVVFRDVFAYDNTEDIQNADFGLTYQVNGGPSRSETEILLDNTKIRGGIKISQSVEVSGGLKSRKLDTVNLETSRISPSSQSLTVDNFNDADMSEYDVVGTPTFTQSSEPSLTNDNSFRAMTYGSGSDSLKKRITPGSTFEFTYEAIGKDYSPPASAINFGFENSTKEGYKLIIQPLQNGLGSDIYLAKGSDFSVDEVIVSQSDGLRILDSGEERTTIKVEWGADGEIKVTEKAEFRQSFKTTDSDYRGSGFGFDMNEPSTGAGGQITIDEVELVKDNVDIANTDLTGDLALSGSLFSKQNENVTVSQDLKVEEDLYVNGNATADNFVSSSADLAEVYSAPIDYEPGTVVTVSDGEEDVKEASRFVDVAGVVSTDPGFTLNSGEEGVEVALEGRVPVKVSERVEKGESLAAGAGGLAVSCEAEDVELDSGADNSEIVSAVNRLSENQECLKASFGEALNSSKSGVVEVKLD